MNNKPQRDYQGDYQAQCDYLATLVRRNGIYFDPNDPEDAARLKKFDALENRTQWIKDQLDKLRFSDQINQK